MILHIPKQTAMKWIVRCLRIGFGCLLIYAAIDKIRHPHDFAQMVDNYRVIGEDLSNWTAAFIPYMEIIVGLFLIAGSCLDAVSIINMIFMVVFLILLTQAWIRGLDISCGCFSVEEGHAIDLQKFLSNVLYAILSVVMVVLVFNPPREALNARHESPDQKRG